jgi:hypothetical protein
MADPYVKSDDAPLTASKHQSYAVDAATDSLVEDKGNTLIGRAVTINRGVARSGTYGAATFTAHMTITGNAPRARCAW